MRNLLASGFWLLALYRCAEAVMAKRWFAGMPFAAAHFAIAMKTSGAGPSPLVTKARHRDSG